jgi:signal transduction histidine kinase
VLINLLKNAGEAFDACDRKADRKLDVRLSKTDPGTVRAVIQDNAVGFDPSQGERLFDQGFSPKNRSSGMGLRQCRDIVVSHGGTLRMETAGPGKGAAAIIELPGMEERTE